MSKQEKTMLHVMATEKASVLPVGATNQGQVMFIGKVMNKELSRPGHAVFDIIQEGAWIPYHWQHVDYLKKGDLLALNLETAQKAGVTPVFLSELKEF